ncbi:MAG: Serine-pyruvate aminotransferase [Alphaproteobacteria bacterium MarineAlpha9_Bin7]|nr:MAG: Serine-pyruvate aminotransferase [Alphaproteobacteria bacterium MarineAlpha9_Bin7]
MTVLRGRQFLHTPGPTNMPDRILRAMDRPAIDHRGQEFKRLSEECFDGLRSIFGTQCPVLVFPSAGHGAWEAALVNTCSPGDSLLMAETGAFSAMWKGMAEAFGLVVEYLPGDWRHGADPDAIYDRLAKDRDHTIKAVAIVHNETSTGITTRLPEVREAIDRANHPALFLVDTISSLASMDFRMDDWRVDVAIGGSQKGLMLPPGLSFNGISKKALRSAQASQLPSRYWDWNAIMPDGETPGFLSTPAINMFFGLHEALTMLKEEGLDKVFERHARLAGAVRQAIVHWGQEGCMELLSKNPREQSNSVTAVLMADKYNADDLRESCMQHTNVALAAGLNRFSGKVFRIGHLGDLNEPMILGTLSAIEMTLKMTGVDYRPGGTTAAIDSLAERFN